MEENVIRNFGVLKEMCNVIIFESYDVFVVKQNWDKEKKVPY